MIRWPRLQTIYAAGRSPVAILAAAGAFIHVITAILRLNTFFPSPRLADFAIFYTAAWAVRSGQSPYDISEPLIGMLRQNAGLYKETLAPHLNPPVWSWLLQPLTYANYPTAAWLWLLLLVGLVAWCTALLVRCAGLERQALPAVFLTVLTFGPTFLTLTLGQNSLFLLLAALLIGAALHRPARDADIATAIAATLAILIKLFPLVWMLVPLRFRHWRLLLFVGFLAGITLGLTPLYTPVGATSEYWTGVLPDRIMQDTEQAALDDQSLPAYLDRLGRHHTYVVPGLSVTDRQRVEWSPPWAFERASIRRLSYLLAILVAFVPLLLLVRQDERPREAEGVFYLWVLYSLVIVPHVTRYDHVLLLPAMAWLWRYGATGRAVAIGAYFLTGLSRLNHLWALILPAPLGPLATGFGLYAVLLLGAGIVLALRRPLPQPAYVPT